MNLLKFSVLIITLSTCSAFPSTTTTEVPEITQFEPFSVEIKSPSQTQLIKGDDVGVYSFSYDAGRYPLHRDRYHEENRDASGKVHGKYGYINAHTGKWVRVEYEEDEEGYKILSSDLAEPSKDTPIVAAAKEKHLKLYEKIAKEHAEIAEKIRALAELEEQDRLLREQLEAKQQPNQ